MNTIKLTIAIPTYDRKEDLKNTIKILLPQIKQCKLLVVDNASIYDVDEILDSLINESAYKNQVTVIRNKANIGMCANILRCYEMVDTEWMWLLSDDDIPQYNAVETILGDIKKYNKSAFLNYSTELYMRKQDKIIIGLEELIENMDSFQNLLFISTGVYHVSVLLSNLRYGYIFSYSMAPHLAVLLMSIEKNRTIVLRKDQIVSWKIATKENKWLDITMAVNLPTFLELPLQLDKKHFGMLANLLNSQILHPCNGLLHLLSIRDLNTFYVRYLVRQIYFRRYETDDSLYPFRKKFIKNMVAFVGVLFPESIINFIRVFFEKKQINDFFNRI